MTAHDVPATPRPAATVMVVRPRPAGFDVFMVRRHGASAFAADLYVFPGGTVRADDRLSSAEARALGLDPAALHAVLRARDDPFATHEDGGLSLWVAALRELFEEAGILLAHEGGGTLLDLSIGERAERFKALRTAVQEGHLSLAALARREGLYLAADRLAYFSRWITPAFSPRRYDTRFLVAELPTGQTAEHCQIETVDGVWVPPRQALSRQAEDDFPMMFVTREHIKRLAEFESAAALVEFTHAKPTRAVHPAVDDQLEPYLTTEQQQWW